MATDPIPSPTITQSDLDELMSRPVTDLTSNDIDTIVGYHRTQRNRRASGEKTTKPHVDLSSIVNKIKSNNATTNVTPLKRRI